MEQNVVVLSFTEESKAFEALAQIKTAAVQGRLKLHAAAVVQRDDQGFLAVKDAASDGAVASVALNGTLIGAVVGMLAGPLGILLGGLYGAVIGDYVAVERAQDRISVMEQIGSVIPAGATAVVAQIEELSTEAVDSVAQHLDATLLRRPRVIVESEVQAQQEAHAVAAEAAARVLRAQQHAQWQHKVEHWKQETHAAVDSLKARLGGKKA